MRCEQMLVKDLAWSLRRECARPRKGRGGAVRQELQARVEPMDRNQKQNIPRLNRILAISYRTAEKKNDALDIFQAEITESDVRKMKEISLLTYSSSACALLGFESLVLLSCDPGFFGS